MANFAVINPSSRHSQLPKSKPKSNLPTWCIIVGIIDVVLLFLLLFLPYCDKHSPSPSPINNESPYKIYVRDAQTGRPIKDAKVAASVIIDGEEDSIVITTDGNGMAEMPFKDSDDRINDMYVTKDGYAGERIYDESVEDVFGDDSTLIVKLWPPTECNDQKQDNLNRDKGMHTVDDYDMGQDGGTFVFEYFTDNAPDEIIVYDCPSNSLDSSKIIFRYSGASGVEVFSKTINFSSRVITVVVNGGTNWYYIVHCPRD